MGTTEYEKVSETQIQTLQKRFVGSHSFEYHIWFFYILLKLYLINIRYHSDAAEGECDQFLAKIKPLLKENIISPEELAGIPS